MKGVMGIALIGGGVFLLIALVNGTLHFPLGNLGQGFQNPLDALGSISNPTSGVTATGKKWVSTDPNGNCPKGYVQHMIPSGHMVCQQP